MKHKYLCMEDSTQKVLLNFLNRPKSLYEKMFSFLVFKFFLYNETKA